jgi:hypothetical protein
MKPAKIPNLFDIFTRVFGCAPLEFQDVSIYFDSIQRIRDTLGQFNCCPTDAKRHNDVGGGASGDIR